VIDVGDRDLPKLRPLAWAALVHANNPPRLFRQGKQLVVVDVIDGRAVLHDLDAARLRHELAQAARFIHAGRWQLPPEWLVQNLFADPSPPLPALDRIVAAPVFASDGRLSTRLGYSAASRTFFAPEPGWDGVDLPEDPSADEIAWARWIILDELLGDFPFCTASDRANAVSALLLPFVRDLIGGPTPLYLIEAPSAGTGKSLLGRTLCLVFLGAEPPAHAAPDTDREWRVGLTTWLRPVPSVLLVDNVSGRLASDALAEALTALVWSDRLLGGNDLATLPVRCLWIITGNNLTLSTDLARRSVRIRLDARVERPFLRTGFRHDLPSWALDHRGDLVRACLILVRAWLAASRPAWSGKVLGSFEEWSRVLGGILAHAGIDGFLAEPTSLLDVADEDGAAWRAFVLAWWAEHQGEPVTTARLYETARNVDGLDLGRADESGQRNRLGRMLNKARDRVIAGYTVRQASIKEGKRRWRLELVEERVSDSILAPDEIRL
jgi:hypothetical protein